MVQLANQFGSGAWKAWVAGAVVFVATLPGVNDMVTGVLDAASLPDATRSVIWAVIGYAVVWAKKNAET